ncbi:MAG: hypothetical protein NC084_06135 [Bacteroides sp.]|nr:hypothetical protein [Eubacterium sp.]MCM1418097.1 hypothetical protein [Roseburia sp.]MCM1462279.1 hypothetical protein [Bacteroides sp.]
MNNKSIIAILVGIIALAAGALTAAYFIKKRLDAEYDDESFEDFDMIGDEEDFFGEDDYDAIDPPASSDSIPYTDHLPTDKNGEE